MTLRASRVPLCGRVHLCGPAAVAAQPGVWPLVSVFEKSTVRVANRSYFSTVNVRFPAGVVNVILNPNFPSKNLCATLSLFDHRSAIQHCTGTRGHVRARCELGHGVNIVWSHGYTSRKHTPTRPLDRGTCARSTQQTARPTPTPHGTNVACGIGGTREGGEETRGR